MVFRNRLVPALGAAVAMLMGSGSVAGGPRQYGWRLDGSAYLGYGHGLETAHTQWCKPSALGPVKGLFLVNKAAAYDVPELGRRVDLKIHGMPAATWLRLGENYWLSLWLKSSSSSERAGRFEAMLDDKYDVIVLGNYRFLSLYEAIQYKILEKVANGCGLLMFYAHDVDARLLRRPLPEASERLSIGTPFAGLDYYKNLFMSRRGLLRSNEIGPHLFRAYQFGRGRVLEVDYATQSSVFDAVPGSVTPFMKYTYTAPVQYDYHQSMAVRCLLWAAGKQPRLVWTRPLPDGMEVAALSGPQSVKIEAAWSGSERAELVLWKRVRDRWGHVAHEGQAGSEFEPGPIRLDVVLPPLPGGVHFVDLIVSSDDGVENWGSFAVNVCSSLRIDAIEPSDTFYERDQDVTGRVVLSRRVTDGEDAALSLTLEDGYERVFSAATIPVELGADRIAFRIPQGNVVSWGARLRAKVLLDKQPTDRDEVELRFRRPSRGEYPIAMWGAVAGYGNHIGNLQMRKLGFTTVLADSPLSQARDDLGWMTFGSGRGAQIHSLGDEIPIPTPKKGKVFGEFLRKRYTSLDELNAAWGTSYAAWEDAEPSCRATDSSAPSFVRLHDTLSCGEVLFAQMCRRRREKIIKANPTGVVGPEGSPVGDPELTLPEVTFWGPYLTIRDNLLVNAVAKPGLLRGNWFGGYVEDRRVFTRLRHVLWLSILGGNNMIEYFTIQGGLLAPDLTQLPFTDEFMKSWNQLRRGLGPQLAGCRPAGNPVAILHSQASQHIGRAGGNWTSTIKAHEFMLGLLGDAGYSPQYVTSGQVQTGRLRKGDVEVLFLLHAFALSDDEIAEIESFAARGGTVIADIPPAWFDERCRLRAARAMDAFFGLERAAPKASLRRRLSLMQQSTRVPWAGGTMLLRGRDPALVTAGSDSLPVVVVKEHSRGHSILLNGVIWKEAREDAQTVGAWRNVLEVSAQTPPTFQVRFRHALGKLGTGVYSYQREDIWIDAVLPPEATTPGVAVVPVLSWPQTKHTYDLRKEAYLGHLDHLEQPVDRSSARPSCRAGRSRRPQSAASPL